jgi:hypothetical protein
VEMNAATPESRWYIGPRPGARRTRAALLPPIRARLSSGFTTVALATLPVKVGPRTGRCASAGASIRGRSQPCQCRTACDEPTTRQAVLLLCHSMGEPPPSLSRRLRVTLGAGRRCRFIRERGAPHPAETARSTYDTCPTKGPRRGANSSLRPRSLPNSARLSLRGAAGFLTRKFCCKFGSSV